VVARYSVRVNGVTDLFVTKLDVLSKLDKVPICVGYEVDGVRYDEIPMTQTGFHHAVPVYEYQDGWWEDISEAKTFADLPENAQAYVRTIEELSGAPVAAIGVGPRRDQTLQLRPLH
jgi:adenylosuccinate synthase